MPRRLADLARDGCGVPAAHATGSLTRIALPTAPR